MLILETRYASFFLLNLFHPLLLRVSYLYIMCFECMHSPLNVLVGSPTISCLFFLTHLVQLVLPISQSVLGAYQGHTL